MAANILKESEVCLAEAKSCGLTHTLVHEALQAEKCWDMIKDILHLKLCNVQTYICTHYILWKFNKGTMKLWQPMYTQFKTEAKMFDFTSDTVTICIFVKGLWDTHNITAKIYEKDP